MELGMNSGEKMYSQSGRTIKPIDGKIAQDIIHRQLFISYNPVIIYKKQ